MDIICICRQKAKPLGGEFEKIPLYRVERQILLAVESHKNSENDRKRVFS